MSIWLPAQPRPRDFKPRLVRVGQDNASPFDGSIQRINRLGDRWAIDCEFDKIRREPYGRVWSSRLAQAASGPVLFYWPQFRGGVASPGAPVVDGAGQAGMVLNVRGCTPGHVFGEGQFFSFLSGGRHYTHQLTADDVVAGDGRVSLNILPMLRVSPADGDGLQVTAPIIEGLIPDGFGWDQNRFDHIGFSLTVTEN